MATGLLCNSMPPVVSCLCLYVLYVSMRIEKIMGDITGVVQISNVHYNTYSQSFEPGCGCELLYRM